MARRKASEKRKVLPDPKYSSILVSQFINTIMLSGKKSVAEKIVYGALDQLEKKYTKENPVELLQSIIDRVSPPVEVRSRKVGGATYQVPVEVRSTRKQTLAFRWLISAARNRGSKSMRERLSLELIDAHEGRGGAMKRRDEVCKMAEANRAFGNFRW